MPPPNALPSLERLKRQAKQIKQATGCTHCQALHELAKVHGFKTYAALLAAHKESEKQQRATA